MQMAKDTIIISDLEVFYRVGIGAEERSRPQRLLVTMEMAHNFKSAAARDDLAETIDYATLCQRLLHFGEDTQWALIETIASDLAQMILEEFSPSEVTVEVKKFVIPQARYVAVRVVRPV